MALSPRLYLDFGSLALRVAIGINSKTLGLIPACSLVEEPDVGTSVSCDITHLGGPLDPSIPRLRRLPGRVGGERPADWKGCCDAEPKYCSGGGGNNWDQSQQTVPRGSFRTVQGLRPSPASGSPAPSPLAAAARDSTRASCTRAPSKQKQRRRDGRGRARALARHRSSAATIARLRPAGGGRAEGTTLFTARLGPEAGNGLPGAGA